MLQRTISRFGPWRPGGLEVWTVPSWSQYRSLAHARSGQARGGNGWSPIQLSSVPLAFGPPMGAAATTSPCRMLKLSTAVFAHLLGALPLTRTVNCAVMHGKEMIPTLHHDDGGGCKAFSGEGTPPFLACLH